MVLAILVFLLFLNYNDMREGIIMTMPESIEQNNNSAQNSSHCIKNRFAFSPWNWKIAMIVFIFLLLFGCASKQKYVRSDKIVFNQEVPDAET